MLTGSRLRLGALGARAGRLVGHLHGGAGGLADGTRETADLERELQERVAQGGWRATCTGERADHGPAPWKRQTESMSQERAPPSISRSSGALCAHWIEAETGSSGSVRGSSGSVRGAAGGWRLEGHLHGGIGRLAVSTRETPD